MPPSKKILFAVTEEMREAIESYCAERGLDKSDLIREAVLKKIGRKDLIDTMRGRGKPRKPD